MAISGGWVIVVEIASPGAVVYWNRRACKAASTTIEEMEPTEIMALTVALPDLEDYSAQKVAANYDAEFVRRFALRLEQPGGATNPISQAWPHSPPTRYCTA